MDASYSFQFTQNFEELFFKAKDGAKINDVYFKSPKPKGNILYFHGNVDNLARWGKIAGNFVKYDYDVLVSDYRAYGKSTYKTKEEAFYQDARILYEYVVKNSLPLKLFFMGFRRVQTLLHNLLPKLKPKS